MSNSTQQPIFALDIGTRTVVGIMMQEIDNEYKLLDYVVKEHKERSMIDGQIHDVLAVSEVIRKVKEELEERYGSLAKVAVAAAGRSLRTKKTVIERSIEGRALLTREDILAMELEGVQEAQMRLAQEYKDSESNYYCVGYSVIHYYLDGQEIGNLIDQRGQQASVEIIATFLPQVVVDSLLSALKRAGLEMEALTLEPIAAINVLIPSTMRRLNIALVDIGAGTSDIAITAEGAITAYGMVPYAGDEVTEAISQQFVLDFSVAEQVKRKLHNNETVEFEDVLGFQQQMPSIDVVKSIQSNIQQLAENISKEILALNGKAPQAVLLIGGGSLTPTLSQWLSELLGLPQNRVGVRSLTTNQNQAVNISIDPSFNLQGPEMVTPIGIAIAAKQHPVRYKTAKVNEQTVRLFDLMNLTIGDALLATGINIKKLHGKPGLALTVTVNEQKKYIPGTLGQPPHIVCNGQSIALDASLPDEAVIEVKKGNDGKNAEATVHDVIHEASTLDVYVNQKLYSIEPTITVNGNKTGAHTKLHDRDVIHYETPRQLADVLQSINGISIDQLDEKHISIYFNGQPLTITKKEKNLYVNDRPAQLEDFVRSGDHIKIDKQVSSPFMFQDVFRYVNIDIKQPVKGKKLAVRVNQKEAGFDTPINSGDELELKWEPMN